MRRKDFPFRGYMIVGFFDSCELFLRGDPNAGMELSCIRYLSQWSTGKTSRCSLALFDRNRDIWNSLAGKTSEFGLIISLFENIKTINIWFDWIEVASISFNPSRVSIYLFPVPLTLSLLSTMASFKLIPPSLSLTTMSYINYNRTFH